MNDGREILDHLRQCTGSETLYRHSLVRSFTYTDGVQFFARNAGGGAYWLLDILATESAIRKQVMEDGFATVRLFVTGSKARLVVDDGNGNAVYTRAFDFTDCPERPKNADGAEEPWMFFIEPNTLGDGTNVMTMMWPSER